MEDASVLTTYTKGFFENYSRSVVWSVVTDITKQQYYMNNNFYDSWLVSRDAKHIQADINDKDYTEITVKAYKSVLFKDKIPPVYYRAAHLKMNRIDIELTGEAVSWHLSDFDGGEIIQFKLLPIVLCVHPRSFIQNKRDIVNATATIVFNKFIEELDKLDLGKPNTFVYQQKQLMDPVKVIKTPFYSQRDAMANHIRWINTVSTNIRDCIKVVKKCLEYEDMEDSLKDLVIEYKQSLECECNLITHQGFQWGVSMK